MGKVSAQTAMATAPDSSGKSMLRAGAVSAFVLVIGYLLTFPIYAGVGDAPPQGVEAQLAYFATHAKGWWAILGLMVFTDLLYVPIYVALYQALRDVNRHAMRLAAACAGLFVVLDLALTWTAYSTLLLAGGQFAGAATGAQRAAAVAAASYPSAMLGSPLLGTYAVLLPSLAILFAGLVMRRGPFSKAAWLALAVGATGIVFMGSYFVGALGVLRIINALLATAWYGWVGWGLWRLGRE